MNNPSASTPLEGQEVSASPPPSRPWRRWLMGIGALVLVSMFTGASLQSRWAWTQYQPAEGDVLFQSLPRTEIVNCIEGATGSPWSHCGIVAKEEGRWVVYEAIVTVRRTPLDQFYARGRGGRFAAYRLKDEHRDSIPKTLAAAKTLVGRPYDTRYRMDDESIYCSELIYKAYRTATGDALGKTVRLRDLKWRPYQRIIEYLEQGPVPLDREMITPRDLAAAGQLEFLTGHDVPAR